MVSKLDDLVPDAARREWQALAEVLARRGPAPCEGTVLPAETWWSAEADDSALAVQACELYPAMFECLAYAVAADESHGVWGASTPGRRTLIGRAAS